MAKHIMPFIGGTLIGISWFIMMGELDVEGWIGMLCSMVGMSLIVFAPLDN